MLASVVRAAGKASVSLVPPVAASGLRGSGRWEGAGAGGLVLAGGGVLVLSLSINWMCMKRKPGKGFRVDQGTLT